MGRRKEDWVDLACRAWATQRRKTLGLDELDRERDGKLVGKGAPASEYLGAIRCTLAARRDLPAFAASGKVEQHFPEVYTGETLLVHRAYRSMPNSMRDVMDAHYIARAPVDMKAEALAISVRSYWERVGQMKRYVEGWLNAHTRPAQEV